MTTHDFTKMHWGHNIETIKDNHIIGWCSPRVKEGDTVVWNAARGMVTKVLVNVKNYSDPPDMFSADFVDQQDHRMDHPLGCVGMVLICASLVACAHALGALL